MHMHIHTHRQKSVSYNFSCHSLRYLFIKWLTRRTVSNCEPEINYPKFMLHWTRACLFVLYHTYTILMHYTSISYIDGKALRHERLYHIATKLLWFFFWATGFSNALNKLSEPQELTFRPVYVLNKLPPRSKQVCLILQTKLHRRTQTCSTAVAEKQQIYSMPLNNVLKTIIGTNDNCKLTCKHSNKLSKYSELYYLGYKALHHTVSGVLKPKKSLKL